MLNFLDCGNLICSFCTEPNTSTNSMALDKPLSKVWSFSKNPLNPLNGPWVISIISPGLNSSYKGSSLVQRRFKQSIIVSGISIGSDETPNLRSWETPLVDLIGKQLLVTSVKYMNKYLGKSSSVTSWILPCYFFWIWQVDKKTSKPWAWRFSRALTSSQTLVWITCHFIDISFAYF